MSVDGGTHTYGHDATHQLTSVSGAQSHSFDYDDVGNREEVNGDDYTSNSLNQYTEVDNVAFDYDERGNLVDDGVNTYRYDLESRLDSVVTASTTVTFEYDPFGRRQMMSVGGTETYYIYDGDHLLAEYDGSGNLKREYVYGANLDEPISILKTGPNARYFYYQDALGSVSEILDANGVLFEQYDYTPYGKATIKTRTGTVLSSSAIGNRFAFTGRRLDYESKLYDYRARVYSTEIGRFLQRDPLSYEDGMNLYTYVHNNPTTFIDPYGMASWWETTRHTMGMSWGKRFQGWNDIHKAYSGVESNTARHYRASKAMCAQYGPADAAMAGVVQEYVSFWGAANRWRQGRKFDWSGYDTAADFYNDYRGIRDGMK